MLIFSVVERQKACCVLLPESIAVVSSPRIPIPSLIHWHVFFAPEQSILIDATIWVPRSPLSRLVSRISLLAHSCASTVARQYCMDLNAPTRVCWVKSSFFFWVWNVCRHELDEERGDRCLKNEWKLFLLANSSRRGNSGHPTLTFGALLIV